jgi:putative effector of murein hydrolase
MTWLLGPATVALALPLYNNRRLLRQFALPLSLGLMAGTGTTMAVALWSGHAAGLEPTLLRSLAPKSVTAPIAIDIAALTGGDPALAVAFVVTTGMLGSMVGPLFLSRLGISHPVARGVALGTTAHGQGTAIALLEGETQGAMAGISMALAAVWTACIAPFCIPFLLKIVGAGG